MTDNRRCNVCVLDARIYIKWHAPRPSADQMRFSVEKTDGFRSWPATHYVNCEDDILSYTALQV